MREVELKAIVPDAPALQRALDAAGAVCTFRGSLSDRRYDTARSTLFGKDHVLRVRTYTDASGARATVDWKGPTHYQDGYKVREELSTAADDAPALVTILDRLGYVVVGEIDRDIAQYTLCDTTVHIEWYPRMDVLVEVEGEPAAIERAIAVTGIPRDAFTAERLSDFVARYEARTGQPAAVSARELAGDHSHNASRA